MTAASDSPAPARTSAWLARRVTATWWYTASSVVGFQVMTIGGWTLVALWGGGMMQRPWSVVLLLSGAAASLGSSVVLLAHYRAEGAVGDGHRIGAHWSPTVLWALVAAGVGGLLAGVGFGSTLLGFSLATLSLCLLHAASGWRVRVVAVIVFAVVVLWVLDARLLPAELMGALAGLMLLTALLPPIAAFSLWWWDVVVALDHARATESRLAAAQERLRLAGDLHDLQGHHLQVIALQLELAERMLPRDPPAAAEQVRLARASVDAARRGTRELAGRFRGVPLPDELANAADLLRAAGLAVELEVAPGAAYAPADVLGPVVRECTTNVLKHGGGSWAHLSLRRVDGAWVLRVANDPGPGGSGIGAGSGLDGIAERVGAVGGELRSRAGEEFEVVVSVPAAGGGRA